MTMTKPNRTMAKTAAAVHQRLYRASKGRLFKKMGVASVGIIEHTGRKSGRVRRTPVIVFPTDTGWMTCASFAGHDYHPDWYLNLCAQPTATVTIGDTTTAVVARTLDAEERPPAWASLKERYPDYAEYEKVSAREIPVVALDRVVA